MAHRILAIALMIAGAGAPAVANEPDVMPMAMAPTAGPDAKYCLKVDALTGSNIERIRCWTREKWADQGVDVDKEWAKEGVRVIG